MSVQPVNDRNLRRAVAGTGLTRLSRVLRHRNDQWLGRVETDEGHFHVLIDPRTWDWEVDDPPMHFASCDLAGHWPAVKTK
jgi:hypothetical protein